MALNHKEPIRGEIYTITFRERKWLYVFAAKKVHEFGTINYIFVNMQGYYECLILEGELENFDELKL